MKILFVCKYNRFRSKVAEAYFNKINKNKKIKSFSGGILLGNYPLSKEQVVTAKKLGINLKGRPRSISTKLLKEIDTIIITADNVPKEIFNYQGRYLQKIIVWKIKDVKTGRDVQDNKRRIKQIIKKVESLVKTLEKQK